MNIKLHPINRVGMEMNGLNTLTKLIINLADALTSPALAFDWRGGSSGRRKKLEQNEKLPKCP